MVSSFSNPGFPHVHAHPTRLPAMDASLFAAIDSFEASMCSMRVAFREAIDSALAPIRREIALLRRDLVLGVEGDSDPASMCSTEAESIEAGHQKLQKLEAYDGDGNPLRIPSTIQDHSILPLLLSSPMLRAFASYPVKPQLKESVAATIPLQHFEKPMPVATVTTVPFPFSAIVGKTAALSQLANHDANDTSNIKGYGDHKSVKLQIIRLCKQPSMNTNTTKRRHEVLRSLIYNFKNRKAIWHWFFHSSLACYTDGKVDMNDAYLNEINGWVGMYEVGKFVIVRNAKKVFDEMPKRECENIIDLQADFSVLFPTNLDLRSVWDPGDPLAQAVKLMLYLQCKEGKRMGKQQSCFCSRHCGGDWHHAAMPSLVSWVVVRRVGTWEPPHANQYNLQNVKREKHKDNLFEVQRLLHLTTLGNSELHIATLWQMLKPFWNASTITDYIMEIEFLWEKDIKVALWGGNTTSLIFSAFESWLVVEHTKGIFKQQWLSLTCSKVTLEAIMAKAGSQWYVPYQKTQFSILKAPGKSSSVSPSYMAHQPDINQKMRAILIDWLIKVHYKFELMDETQFLAVHLIDRFLERQTVFGQKLQLVDVTATLLACKYEEVYGEMLDKGVNPNEFTYVLLRVKRLTGDIPSYQFIMKTLSDAGKLDKVLNVVDTMRDDDGVEFFNNPITKAMLFLNFASESSDVFKSTYREVAEKYKKEDISFIIGNLKVVVTDGIQEYIKYRKYMWLEFYAPWCGHCKKLVPILDEVAVSYENDSNDVIAKLQATANGVPSDFDVKYYQLPQRLQDQMLAHLCLKFRTDSEDLQQQEPLDMVYLFLGVSNDLLFQWVSAMKAGVYAFFEHLAQFYKIIVYSDYSYMYVDHVMERLDTKHCVTHKLGKAATMYQIAEETYTTQTAVLETAMSTPVFVQGSSNSVCNRYQLRAVVYTADEGLESITDTKTELQLKELAECAFYGTNSNQPVQIMKVMVLRLTCLSILLDSGDTRFCQIRSAATVTTPLDHCRNKTSCSFFNLEDKVVL